MTENLWAHDCRGELYKSYFGFLLNVKREKAIYVFVILLQEIFFENWKTVSLDILKLINIELVDKHLKFLQLGDQSILDSLVIVVEHVFWRHKELVKFDVGLIVQLGVRTLNILLQEHRRGVDGLRFGHGFLIGSQG